MGNKKAEYTDYDVKLLTLLIGEGWKCAEGFEVAKNLEKVKKSLEAHLNRQQLEYVIFHLKENLYVQTRNFVIFLGTLEAKY